MTGQTLTANAAIGARVRAARVAAGFRNQGDALPHLEAAGLTWTQGTLSRVESGVRPLKLVEAATLATALGVTVGHLLGSPEDDATAVRWESLMNAERLALVKRTVERQYRKAVQEAAAKAAADPVFRERVVARRDRVAADSMADLQRQAARDDVDVSTPAKMAEYADYYGLDDIPAIRAASDVLEAAQGLGGEG